MSASMNTVASAPNNSGCVVESVQTVGQLGEAVGFGHRAALGSRARLSSGVRGAADGPGLRPITDRVRPKVSLSRNYLCKPLIRRVER
jgi:hypothetical protein